MTHRGRAGRLPGLRNPSSQPASVVERFAYLASGNVHLRIRQMALSPVGSAVRGFVAGAVSGFVLALGRECDPRLARVVGLYIVPFNSVPP